MSKIIPLANHILVKPIVAEEKTLGGIIIPDSDKSKPLKGEVIAVGEGTKDEVMLVSAGDIVLYKNPTGISIEHDGDNFVIMSQFDVLGIIK